MKILKFLNKTHSLLFYKLVRFVLRLDRVFLDMPDMEWVMYKALIAISLIQLNWYFILLTVLEIVIKKRIPDLFEDKLISALFFLVIISTFNYFTLIYKKRWFKYDKEFAAYSKIKNRVINISIPVFYILSFALFIIVVEIWADLRHIGEIADFIGK